MPAKPHYRHKIHVVAIYRHQTSKVHQICSTLFIVNCYLCALNTIILSKHYKTKQATKNGTMLLSPSQHSHNLTLDMCIHLCTKF